MSGTAIQIQARDNVATLLADTEAGPVRILNAAGGAKDICVTEPIRHGHKVAPCDLSTGDAVFKYGVRIGHATREVPTGSWVPGPANKWINHPDLEIPKPSAVGTIGVLVTAAIVVAMVGFVYWIAGWGA